MTEWPTASTQCSQQRDQQSPRYPVKERFDNICAGNHYMLMADTGYLARSTRSSWSLTFLKWTVSQDSTVLMTVVSIFPTTSYNKEETQAQSLPMDPILPTNTVAVCNLL